MKSEQLAFLGGIVLIIAGVALHHGGIQITGAVVMGLGLLSM